MLEIEERGIILRSCVTYVWAYSDKRHCHKQFIKDCLTKESCVIVNSDRLGALQYYALQNSKERIKNGNDEEAEQKPHLSGQWTCLLAVYSYEVIRIEKTG